MTSRVVYTALFGNTEQLLEQPVATQSTLRFLCFTDNTSLTSKTWEIIPTKPLFPADPMRSQRAVKIRGHEVLRDYDQWLYMDNTVRLKRAPEELLDHWLDGADWAAISHDAHKTLWEEFEANIAMGKDVEGRIHEQLNDYTLNHRAALDDHPVWNGLFARNRNAQTDAFASLWCDHVLRYSGRDQLSFMVALHNQPVTLHRVEGKPRNSIWHDWPHRVGETPQSKKTRHAKTSGLRPLADELVEALDTQNQLRAELADTERELQRLRDRRMFGLAGLIRRLAEARAKRRRELRRATKRG